MGSTFLAMGRAYVTENFYVTSMPPSDRTAIGKAYMRYPDGSGVNTAVALKKLGVSSAVGVKVGDDSFGDVVSEYTASLGVMTSSIIRSSSAQTGVCAVITENLGVSRKIILEGANKTFSDNDVDLAFSIDPDYVILNGDINEEALKAASFKASECGAKALLNLYGDFALSLSLETLCPVEILVIDSPNARRRTDMTPGDTMTNMKICSILASQISANYFVLRCPDGSCFAYNGTYYYVIPAYDFAPVDRTGCDEMFGAALWLMYLLKKNIKLACEFAALAEVIASQRPGGTTSFPSFDDIRAFIKKYSINGEDFN